MKSVVSSIIVWSIVSALYLLVRFVGSEFRPDWASTNKALVSMWIFASVFLGISYWFSLGLSERPSVRRSSYFYIIVYRVIIVLLSMVILVFASRMLVIIQDQSSWSQLLPSFARRVAKPPAIVALAYLVTATAVLSFFDQMGNMVGKRVLINLMMGKYHFPREEKRIFMFLDLKSSTTHAERLGHIQFSKLIQDCFSDLTNAVRKHDVEIYQYVGDEVILTWTIEDGIRNKNCIMVFFEFQRELKSKSTYYNENYGIVPEFKAGINTGPVTAAEVGDVKRDIAYLSDVLNTAARIQGECNKYNEPLLVSAYVKEQLLQDAELDFVLHGAVELRGRMEKVEIYGVNLGS